MRLLSVLAAGLLGCGPASTPLLLVVSETPPQTLLLSVQLSPMNGRMTTRPMVTFARGDFPLGIPDRLFIGLELPGDTYGSFGVRVEAALRPSPLPPLPPEFLAEACLGFSLVAGQLKQVEISLAEDGGCPM